MSHELLLGKPVLYKDQYDASLLFPVPRAQNRALLPLATTTQLPFVGVDLWNAWEVSWLNSKGKPVVAHALFTFPCTAPNIIESKSFKLYLNSFNGSSFSDWSSVQQRLRDDLSNAAGAQVSVVLSAIDESRQFPVWQGNAINLDTLDISISKYDVDATSLRCDSVNDLDHNTVTETLSSQLLKSNCPVTGQPDWATVFIHYTGAKINHESLLRYIISFRNHAEFHEHCVERIFCDVMQQCRCEKLSVYARYTRRGGLDINPFRSTDERVADNFICARQ